VNSGQAEITEQPGIIIVTFTRPEKLNAISEEMRGVLWEATRALAERDDLRVMVITGTGRYFTAGVDIGRTGVGRRLEQEAATSRSGIAYRRNYRQLHLLADEWESIEKPIILAAQGPCLGLGVELACSCDFRFCTPQAHWGLPEIKLGVIAGSGGTSRLTRLVGPHWAKWIAMAGKNVDADTARMIGLVHEIYPEDEFLDRVYAFCRDIIALPAEAVGLAKLSVDLVTPQNREHARHIERLANTTLTDSDEHRERVRRFNERRGPG
jgi:enoyl-CoA hydratase